MINSNILYLNPGVLLELLMKTFHYGIKFTKLFNNMILKIEIHREENKNKC